MLCPNCKIDMLAATTESKYGAKVTLDQCPSCGGIWCDGEELYLAREVKDENYAGLDVTKLTTTVTINPVLKCPRDGAVLSVFKDYNFPKSINIEACPTCQGFWFNRGQLLAFQEAREQKSEASKTESESEFSESMKKLLSSESGTEGYAALGKLGSFLSTPVSQGSGGLYIPDLMSQDTRQAAGWVNMAGSVIYMLLRLFLKV